MDALVDAAWTVLGTPAGALSGPADLPGPAGGWLPADVPGTAAGALRAAHGVDAALAADIDGRDWWWRTCVPASGPHLLLVDGLATIADVWVGGEQVLHSETMFGAHAVEVAVAGEDVEIVIRCAAPLAHLAARGRLPRPRWKSTLVPEQRWRWLRTTALGRIPTWHGAPPAAGPWRALRLLSLDAPVVASSRLTARVAGTAGVLDVRLDVRGPVASATASIGTARAELAREPDGLWHGRLTVPDVQLWWPHTHGAQPRYAVHLEVDGRPEQLLGHIGFRTVAAVRADGGFSLSVNRVAVFARGAVWSPLDPIGLQDDLGAVRDAVQHLADGGHNMIRVPGVSGYETDAFHDACDEIGMLVWQDCALTTLDPPDTDEFTAQLRAEVAQLADRLAGRPSTAVVCGGAETEQQPAMLGLDPVVLPALTEVIPGVLADRLPGVPYVTSTPSGGDLPMHAGTGISQYFGVGAYLRPVADMRSAGVRFAAEALAFSTPPEPDRVRRAFGSARPAGHRPEWKRAVPRDPSASWDFEDVRDHYVRTLFDVDPVQVRYADPERYLDLGRAAVCVAMTEVFSWWRRPASRCGGGLVLSARDLTPGAGWGLVDHTGRAKAPWFALRPVLAPLALLVSDDGADGVGLTVVNDGPEPVVGRLEICTWSAAGAAVDRADRAIEVGAHSATQVSLDAALGRFTDAGHYYRFGPRVRDLLQVRLVPEDGTVPVQYVAELGHHLRPVRQGGLEATVRAATADDPCADAAWVLDLRADLPAHWVALDCAWHEPADSWFHLAPGQSRTVALREVRGRPVGDDPPAVLVRALDVVEFSAKIESKVQR